MITIKSKFNLVLALIALAAVCLSCTFIKGKLSRDPLANIEPPLPVNIPKFDPKAPLFSPGAEVVRRLSALDPSLAEFTATVEAVERETMNKAVSEVQGSRSSIRDTDKPNSDTTLSGTANVSNAAVNMSDAGVSPVAAMFMLQGSDDTPDNRAGGAALIGAVIAGMKDIFTKDYNDAKNAGGVNKRTTETKDGTTTTMGVELVFRDDGSSVFGLELKTESVKNGVKVVAEMSGRVDGLDCPNADGQVPITINLRLGGESKGVGYTQDLRVFVRATVDDNAQITSRTFDITQGTRQIKNGREVYVETGQTLKYNGASGEYSNFRLIRHSQSAWENPQEAEDLAANGQDAAYRVGQTVLGMAESKWQSGGCVQIVANSPGSVAVSSSTQMPVKVVHKFGGADVPSKLEAVLSGESSVDPSLIPRTAGTLTYVAPGESGKSATITLTATSKRGIATLDLTASTGGNAYRIVGGVASLQTDTVVCDVMKPFTLSGAGFTYTFSGGLSGTHEFAAPGYGSNGSGPYTISLPEGIGKPGSMTGEIATKVLGRYRGGSGTEKYTLTPIEPCSQ